MAETFSYIQITNTTSPTDPPPSSLLLIFVVSGWRRPIALHPSLAAGGERGFFRGPPSKCCIVASVFRGASSQAERRAAPPQSGRMDEGEGAIGGELTVAVFPPILNMKPEVDLRG